MLGLMTWLNKKFDQLQDDKPPNRYVQSDEFVGVIINIRGPDNNIYELKIQSTNPTALMGTIQSDPMEFLISYGYNKPGYRYESIKMVLTDNQKVPPNMLMKRVADHLGLDTSKLLINNDLYTAIDTHLSYVPPGDGYESAQIDFNSLVPAKLSVKLDE